MARTKAQPDAAFYTITTDNVVGLPITIDGEVYFTVPPAWWGQRQKAKCAPHMNWARQFERRTDMDGENAQQPTEEEYQVYYAHLRETMQVLLPDCPPEQIKRIPDGHLEGFIRNFFIVLANWRDTGHFPEMNGTRAG